MTVPKLREDLRHLKQILEAGEIPTNGHERRRRPIIAAPVELGEGEPMDEGWGPTEEPVYSSEPPEQETSSPKVH